MTLLFWLAVADSAWMLITRHPYGLLNNKAADASFIATMLPMVFQKGLYRWKVYVSATLMVSVILFTKSSTGIAAMGVGVSAILFQTSTKKTWFLISILGAITTGLFGYTYLGTELIDPSGRQIIWREAWNLAIHKPWFGHGTGSWTIAYKNFGGGWYWLHNDYLEVFFENGIIGLALVLAVSFYAIRSLYKKHLIEFPIAIVYGFTAITEMPLRLFITQILGVILLSKAFASRPNKRNDSIFPHNMT